MLKSLVPEIGAFHAITWEPIYAGKPVTRVIREWEEVSRCVAKGSLAELQREDGHGAERTLGRKRRRKDINVLAATLGRHGIHGAAALEVCGSVPAGPGSGRESTAAVALGLLALGPLLLTRLNDRDERRLRRAEQEIAGDASTP